MGKHSLVSSKPRAVARAASVAVAGAVLGIAAAHPASASTQSDLLEQLIECESGGDPTIVNQSGGTASGAWQITNGTWSAFGGRQFAPTAAQASLSEQNTVAIRISAGQGADAWVCAPPGLKSPFSAADVATATGTRAAAPSARAAAPRVAPTQVSTSDYEVVAGDALSMIAARAGVDWHQVWERNRDVIGDDPDRIFPGQHLVVGA